MSNSTADKLLLTSQEAADALGVCTKTIYSITKPRGPLPCVRIGTSVRYSRRALEQYVSERESANA
jgi:excisionase family DNA binding protein